MRLRRGNGGYSTGEKRDGGSGKGGSENKERGSDDKKRKGKG